LISGAVHSQCGISLPSYLLSSQCDRMAMAHSVEGRYPFLNYRVVEFGAKLPLRLKMKVLNQKYLLKRASGVLFLNQFFADQSSLTVRPTVKASSTKPPRTM
jgi:asparagine synthetase B (glutamine-hydrolysing)